MKETMTRNDARIRLACSLIISGVPPLEVADVAEVVLDDLLQPDRFSSVPALEEAQATRRERLDRVRSSLRENARLASLDRGPRFTEYVEAPPSGDQPRQENPEGTPRNEEARQG